jgi:hypothetical protein
MEFPAMGQREFVPGSIRNSAVGFLVKPFQPYKMKNMMEKLERGLSAFTLPGNQGQSDCLPFQISGAGRIFTMAFTYKATPFMTVCAPTFKNNRVL